MREQKPNQAKAKLEMTGIGRRIGKQVIEAEAVGVTGDGKQGGRPLLDGFSYSFSPEDRIGIIGPTAAANPPCLISSPDGESPPRATCCLGRPFTSVTWTSTPKPSTKARGSIGK